MKYLPLLLLVLCLGCAEFFAPNISEVEIELLAPQDSIVTNANTIQFLWEAADQVEQYRFQLAQPSFAEIETLLDTLVSSTSLELSVPEGAFEWSIRAEHPGSESEAVFRQGWVDQTPPLLPVLLSPIGEDTVSGAVFLRWEHADNLDWAAVTDSVWVYQEVDSFLELRVRRVVSEQETLVEGLAPGNYAWFVKSVDQAGNVSGERGEEFVVE